MNVDQLRYFVATVEEGGFSRAARKLSVTTQCVSKAVGNLEREVGAPLLSRTGQGARATGFGHTFAQHARAVLRAFDETEKFARAFVLSHPHGAQADADLRVLVCVPYFPRMGKVAEGIELLIGKQLGVRAEVSFGACSSCVDALERRAADVAIVIGEPEDPSLDLAKLGTVPCGVQVAAESPLARKEPLFVADVLPYPAYLWPNYDYFNNYVRLYLAQHGIQKDVVESAGGLFFSKAARQGVVFMPRLASLDTTSYDTQPLAFDASEKFSAPVYLATSKKSASPLGQAAKDALRQAVLSMQLPRA